LDKSPFQEDLPVNQAEQKEQKVDDDRIVVKRGYFAADQWEEEKRFDPAFCATVPTMEKLMRFTGLEKVKISILQLFRRISLARFRGTNPSEIPLNFRFVGNPGTVRN
jgi:hypothetical protein